MFLPRIVLVKPSHPGNIGAVARAMKVMGLTSLYLVSPRQFPHEEATALAVHADDILEKAVVVSHLTEALEDITYVYATSANARSEALPIFTAREAAINIVEKQQAHYTAIIFGPENYGLSHEDLCYAHALIQIPTANAYHSLNLAAAVQVIAYEYQISTLEKQMFASMSEMESFYQHLEKILIHLQFLNPAKPRNLMLKLRRFFNRAQPDQAEMNIFRGILRSIENMYYNNQGRHDLRELKDKANIDEAYDYKALRIGKDK